MNIVRACLLVATLVISSPAYAGWQWTDWGMTPEQVSAGAPVKVGPYHDAKLDTAQAAAELVTTHHADGFDFSVAMLFDRQTQGLRQVRLLLGGDDNNHLRCADLYSRLQRTYGDPDEATASAASQWRDTGHNNLVTLTVNSGCWLVYEPIPQRGSGL